MEAAREEGGWGQKALRENLIEEMRELEVFESIIIICLVPTSSSFSSGNRYGGE